MSWASGPKSLSVNSRGWTSSTGCWRSSAPVSGSSGWTEDIYEATVRLLRDAPVEPDEDYKHVLERIDRLTEDLPELRESFARMMEAGLRARAV